MTLLSRRLTLLALVFSALAANARRGNQRVVVQLRDSGLGIQEFLCDAGDYRQRLSAKHGTQLEPDVLRSDGSIPGFDAYDVLVIESGEAFRTGSPGGPLATPDYSGI